MPATFIHSSILAMEAEVRKCGFQSNMKSSELESIVDRSINQRRFQNVHCLRVSRTNGIATAFRCRDLSEFGAVLVQRIGGPVEANSTKLNYLKQGRADPRNMRDALRIDSLQSSGRWQGSVDFCQ